MIKKQTILELWRTATTFISILTMAFLYGCGGGGGGGSAPAPNTTTYDISKITSLNTGDTLSISLTGTDTSGGSYSGSIDHVVDGPTIFEGHAVIKRTTNTIINKTNVGTILSVISESYYNNDTTLYKIVFSNSVTATPANVFFLPTTVQIGDQFSGQDLNYSNAAFLQSDWEVVAALGGNAKIVINNLTNTGTDITSWVISSNGVPLSFSEVINNFPSNGVTSTFTGTIN